MAAPTYAARPNYEKAATASCTYPCTLTYWGKLVEQDLMIWLHETGLRLLGPPVHTAGACWGLLLFVQAAAVDFCQCWIRSVNAHSPSSTLLHREGWVWWIAGSCAFAAPPLTTPLPSNLPACRPLAQPHLHLGQ